MKTKYRVIVGFNFGNPEKRYEVGDLVYRSSFPPHVWINIVKSGLVQEEHDEHDDEDRHDHEEV